MNNKQVSLLAIVFWVLVTSIVTICVYFITNDGLGNSFIFSQAVVFGTGVIMLATIGIAELMFKFEHFYDRLGD